MSDVLQGKPGVLVFEGAAGMGKSALMRFAMEMAKEKELRHFICSTDAMDKSSSFYVFKTILCQLLDIEADSEQTSVELIERLTKILKSKDKIEYLPLLNKVLPINVPENNFTKHLSQKLSQVETRRLIQSIIVAETKQEPLMLLIEVMPPSIDILFNLFRRFLIRCCRTFNGWMTNQ